MREVRERELRSRWEVILERMARKSSLERLSSRDTSIVGGAET